MLRLKLEYVLKDSEKYNGDDKNLANALREEKTMNTGLFKTIVGGFNNLSYTTHLRQQYMCFFFIS